ncbi:hypothetical protein KKF34_08395 [Myxococcota bacterium]|nr:hypothetical protein [Myxococcota bacterium]MBU1379734.1 hypothetical protein [Myxococcota bacterium]MBU1496882.1 hypothetical protein [Myxococcota bacterium]
MKYTFFSCIILMFSLISGCDDDSPTVCPDNNCSGHGECKRTSMGDYWCDCEEGYVFRSSDYSCWFDDYVNNDNYKPVIYLYPVEKTVVNVAFTNPENVSLTYTYPQYKDNGWTVTAWPDGTLESDSREYYSLFWEGPTIDNIIFSTGFSVSYDETIPFLEDALLKLGLNDFEAQEFIIYWLPILGESPHNLIYFAVKDWMDAIPLTITPVPDTQIRFIMIYKPMVEPISILPQQFFSPERTGFTLVEWGGRKENGEYRGQK